MDVPTLCIKTVLILFGLLNHQVSSLDIVANCDDLKSYTKGTLYDKAVHYWPLVSLSMLGDAITCQDILQMYGIPSAVSLVSGFYGITTNGLSGLQLPTSSPDEGCFKSFSNCTEGFSVALWINLQPSSKLHASAFDIVIAPHDTLTSKSGFWLIDDHTKGLQASVRTNTYTETTTIPIKRAVWNHVIITWTAHDNITFYVNGEMNDKNSTFTKVIRTTDLSLGLYLSYSTVAGKSSASYRDFAIWNQRLSEKDVLEIYQHTPGCQEIDPSLWNLTASSFADRYTASFGAFNSKTAWCEDPALSGGFIEIQLPFVHHIDGIVIRSKDFGAQEFVKTFKVKFSVDAVSWQDYKVSGAIKTFSGLTSSGTLKKIDITNPIIIARYFRIYPTAAQGRNCLRLRLCGFEQDSLNISASINGTCSVKVNNKEYCPDKDGHNIVAFDYKSGKFLAAKNYDTHQNSGAGDLLEQFVTSLENDTLLLVAVKTSGHRISAKGLKALYKVGAKSLDAPPINTASVLVGLTGSLAEWIRETSAATPGELVATNIIIPLKKEIQPSHYWPLQKVDYYRKKQKNKHYYKHMRDVEGGMDIEYVHSMYIRMGLLIMRPHHMYTRTGWVPNSCFLKPSNCLGGLTVSAWIKFEHPSFLFGETQEPFDKIPFHRTYIHFYSHNSGYISIEGKKRYMVDKGHHVILMDYATGKIRGEAIFKIPTDNTAEHRFAHFINTAPNGTIVLVNGWYKSYITSSDLIKALKSVGAREPQHNPTSISNQIYMLVGYKGLDKMKWIEEAKHNYVTSGTLRVRIPTFGAWISELGMQDGRIRGWQIWSHSTGSGVPKYARLYGVAPGWIESDPTMKLSIHLGVPHILVGIITQGSSTEQAWVTSYKLDYKFGKKGRWNKVQDNGIPTEFVGNTDQHTPVRHTLRQPINLQKIRIIPITVKSKIGLRLELLKLNNAYRWMDKQPRPYKQEIPDSHRGLVFQGKTTPSNQNVTASSVRSAKNRPENAALYNSKTSLSDGCWCPHKDQNQFLSVHLSERSLITSIGVQGCPSSDEWIQTFTVQYKDIADNASKVYMDNGMSQPKIFDGSLDRHTVARSYFERVVYATTFEIHPTSWHEHACLRFELFGYRLESECFGPLLEFKKNIKADSSIGQFKALMSILDTPSSAWCTALEKKGYLHVDFGENVLFSGIATQGYEGGNWTKAFYISYSRDHLTWYNHTRDGQVLVYEGNSDGTSVKMNLIEPYIEARYIRVYPLEGSDSSTACLRLQLFGCFKDNPSFQLEGPPEIHAANSSNILIYAYYRYCRQSLPCPRCKRQLYLDVFGTVLCLIEEVNYNCDYNNVERMLKVPKLPGVYPIRMFDSTGEKCNTSMKRTVPGKVLGRVLAKVYNFTNCLDVLMEGNRKNGVYRIRPGKTGSAMTVFCDQMNHGGGWTVLQRRINGTLDFYKTWTEYKIGFGSLEGEFWLGNDNIHRLTSSPVELLIEMETFSGFYYYAKYASFQIGDGSSKYKMTVSGYSGTAGDSLTTLHNGAKFSTKDNKNYPSGGTDCVDHFQSAWWFNNPCKDSNLNGVYIPTEAGINIRGLKWETLLGLSKNLKNVEMKIRPKQGTTIKCYNWGCFYVINDKIKTAFDARKACWSMGGELGTIRNAQEASDVAGMVTTGVTIGLNDLSVEGKFQGFDGGITTYSNWGFKTDQGRDCVRLASDSTLRASTCTYAHPGYLCQRDLMCYKSSCYRFINGSTLATRDDARTTCQNSGRNLIKIPGDSKSKFIQKYVMPTPRTPLWIGLSDKAKEGTFLWSDGSKLTTPNWKEGQPGAGDCVVINSDGQWETKACSLTAGLVCQKQIAQSCQELLELGEANSGVYHLYLPQAFNVHDLVKVHCDQEKDGGGWEVLLRRQDGSINFHQKLWNDYENGFGHLGGELWIGLQNFYRIRERREIMLRLNNSDGTGKYVKFQQVHLYDGVKYKLYLQRYEAGSLNGEMGRFHTYPFSTVDQDNDGVENKSCSEQYGPGWHWTYTNHKTPRDCFNSNVNLFGPYSPNQIGDTHNLFYTGFGRPITYMEMKTRLREGYQEGVFSTYSPELNILYQGVSLIHASNELRVHAVTSSKAWTLSLTPSHIWTYYTFTWSEDEGIKSYENGLLSKHSKSFINVTAPHRSNVLFHHCDVHRRSLLYIFISKLKFWNTELTQSAIMRDYRNAAFTLEGDVTHWDQDSGTFNWALNSNSTKSDNTGPSHDHTYYGLPQASYYYMESSYPRVKGQTTTLISQPFFPIHKCLTFWYNMYGAGMGELMVHLIQYDYEPYSFNPTINSQEQIIWQQHGNKGKSWKYAVVQINASNTFRISITGVVGEKYTSDIAIDDLSVTISECPVVASNCIPRCQAGYVCLENKSVCDCKGMKHVDEACKYVVNQSVLKETAHHWPLDDAGIVTNLQSNYHGFTNGTVKAVRGAVNNALVTDGLTGRITLADMRSSCLFDFPSCSTGFTLRFWLKFFKNEKKQKRVFLSVGFDKDKARGFQFLQDFSIIQNPNHLITKATIEQSTCVIAIEAFPLIWSTITLTWTRNKGFTLYHNGKNATSLLNKCESVISVSPSNTLLRTGFDNVLPQVSLDDVVLWYKGLEDHEVRNIFRFFTAPQNTITLAVKFPDENFTEFYNNKESVQFEAFRVKILQNAQAIYDEKSSHLEDTKVNELSKGCVIARMSLLFDVVTRTELELLRDALCNKRKFGGMRAHLVDDNVNVTGETGNWETQEVKLCGLHKHSWKYQTARNTSMSCQINKTIRNTICNYL